VTISQSRGSYADCREIMDRALEDSEGIRVKQPGIDEATYMRMRLHQARSIDRRDNSDTYERGHPLHGASVYDPLVIRIKTDSDGQTWLYLERTNLERIEIEPLSTAPPLVSYEPVKQLTGPEVVDTPRIAFRRI